MLKNIRLHLDADDEKQAELELQLSEKIQHQYKRNVQAFRANIPSLLPLITNIQTQNVALFCNKFGEHNIVDYGVGRTLYGLDPQQEIQQQVKLHTEHCRFIDFTAAADESGTTDETVSSQLQQLPAYQQYQQQPTLPAEVDVLVVLGLGLGEHIRRLMSAHKIKHLVIYEPESQYFQCSALITDWANILQTAAINGTAIYLQVGKDGRNIIADLDELSEHYAFNGFYVYQHYNHPIFNALANTLASKSWQQIKRDGISFDYSQEAVNYLPNWTQSVELSEFTDVDPKNDPQFKANLQAFKKYVPNIYQEFKDYVAKVWLPVSNTEGEINVIKKDSLTCWYGDSPKTECIVNFDNFDKHPNKDGLVLGYKGTKLKHYTHYRFVNETEQLLNEVEEEQGQLPEVIKSLIMFGVGSGYQIEHLLEIHKVEKLFLCEPNRDFFYASLFAIDWQQVLETVDKTDGRIYFNIGDDGSNLFRDLLNQFYSIGPYILASTYFYQSYYNATLVQAIAQLREQLQVVISMGEYYDHARFGIAQTSEVINRDYSLLTSKPAKKLSFDNKSVPVFMVGNGPSLDSAIAAIKEWQDQAIIVSCGTSLQVLYKNGIVPDFHAEIEQNRATFDWCCRVGDFDYLKKISLLSCNGIHPDTCDLFKDVYVAFKEGESSTTSALHILGEGKFEKLKFAFPTVSNFVMNLFTSMQFNQLYLIGIDLGFFDNKQHHSKQSGYYNADGDELYDYAAKNNTAMVVPGNFRKTVFTKHEFKVSKAIIEQSLASAKVECFNCSDGAKIVGSIPLQLDYMLITASPEQKDAAIAAITEQAFIKSNQEHDYAQRFEAKFSPQRLEFELGKMIERVAMPVETIADAEGLIESQKSMLFASYQEGKSLLFYLLYGTVNYANAVFSKLLSASGNEQNCIEQFNHAKAMWLNTLQVIYDDYINVPGALDYSGSFFARRELALINIKAIDSFVLCDYPESSREQLIKRTQTRLPIGTPIMNLSELSDSKVSEAKRMLVLLTEKLRHTIEVKLGKYIGFCNKQNSIQLLMADTEVETFKQLSQQHPDIEMSLIYALDKIASEQDVAAFMEGQKPYLLNALLAVWLGKCSYTIGKFRVIIPKLQFVDGGNAQENSYLTKLESNFGEIEEYIEFSEYIALPRRGVDLAECLLDGIGNRGRYVKGRIQLKSIIGRPLTRTQASSIRTLIKNGTIAMADDR
ncbi:DUF115 domain-containing protein [Alteromonadaceae bacterium BrNp21-10]|nr:DUF115 domain-containing protein [Alteromonadaceae bacterium BrNp21-10]